MKDNPYINELVDQARDLIALQDKMIGMHATETGSEIFAEHCGQACVEHHRIALGQLQAAFGNLRLAQMLAGVSSKRE